MVAAEASGLRERTSSAVIDVVDDAANWCKEYSGLSAAQPSSVSETLESAADWQDAGILSEAKPWPAALSAGGTVLGLSLLLGALPLLLPLALALTVCEALRDVLGINDRTVAFEDEGEGKDDEVTLVLPGTCAYVFWQLGMVQYISERFDTRGVKLAGVSSGAIGAVLLLALEEAAARPGPGAASSKVRRRAQEVFKLVERASSPVVKHPLGFLLRLGSVLDKVAAEVIPEKCPEGNRVRVGVRRVAGGLVPALVPGVVTGFKNREDLKEAVLASSTVWLIVRPWPCRYLACKKWVLCRWREPFLVLLPGRVLAASAEGPCQTHGASAHAFWRPGPHLCHVELWSDEKTLVIARATHLGDADCWRTFTFTVCSTGVWLVPSGAVVPRLRSHTRS
ncbi:unnamed protein product [Polarella glacialis]|uniref:Patatin n=1 Tax=Polarella glacialis TaxID=89957 RepID=A0A813DT07_POLGL|nr:unnamed protein product [Polarella glacialis]